MKKPIFPATYQSKNSLQLASPKGFTLIELIMVMVVIAGLASIVLFNFPNATRRARDSQRKNDIKQYQTIIEAFGNANSGLYISRTLNAGQPISLFCTDYGVTPCIVDPRDTLPDCVGSTCRYMHQTNGSGSANVDATSYVFWATLEQPDQLGNLQYYVVCSNGLSGEASAGLPPSPDANCPL